MKDTIDFDSPSDASLDLPPPSLGARGADKLGTQHAYEPINRTREIHLLDHVRVLYKRRRTAAAAFSTIITAVVVYTFMATPVYEARARVLLEPAERNVVEFEQVIDEARNRSDYSQTQLNLLQSRSLARKTLESLKMWSHPAFATAARSTFRELASRALSGSTRADPEAGSIADAETRDQAAAIDRFLNSLTVTPVRNSRIVDIAFRSTDATLASSVANEHVRNFIQQNLDFKFLASKEATDWLGEQLAEQRLKVEESENALQRYREQNDAISLEDRENIVVQKLTDLSAAVTRAKTERIEKEALFNQLQSLHGDRIAVDSFPAVLTNGFIQEQKSELANLQRQRLQLSEKLGDRHPEMIRLTSTIQATESRLQAEISKVVESVRSQFLSAHAQETSLVAALELQKRDALGVNRKGIEYGVLQRDVESNRQIYQSLLQRAKETGVAGELKANSIRIVDGAELPRYPISPRRGFNLLMGFLGGGVFAIALVFFFEYVDSTIKTPDQIKDELRLPFLGMIPHVAHHGDSEIAPLLTQAMPTGFAEAIRSIRTNVLFAVPAEGSRSLLVTSTRPGEGKTLVASSLAIGLAQAGERVLLIDADLRRPRIHETFREAPEPGLSNVIVGSSKVSEAVKSSTVNGLWILTAGRIPPNPAELLGSKRFRGFLASLGSHFDWIVIDSPPVMAVTDVSLIANMTSGVLFVVGADMTSRHAAEAAVEQLETARAKFFGAVLNKVDLVGNAYYYSKYYAKEYASYYAEARS